MMIDGKYILLDGSSIVSQPLHQHHLTMNTLAFNIHLHFFMREILALMEK
jgi:hypothetical protein